MVEKGTILLLEMIEKEQNSLKWNYIGTFMGEKGTTLLLEMIKKEQNGQKLNSKRNIIGQNRNINGWKGNNSFVGNDWKGTKQP